MGIFGRESAADAARARRVGLWAQQRHPLALLAMVLGILAVIDSITMVIGIAAGLGAIVVGMLGLRRLKREPKRLGRRLCLTAIVLGIVGIGMSLTVYAWTTAVEARSLNSAVRIQKPPDCCLLSPHFLQFVYDPSRRPP